MRVVADALVEPVRPALPELDRLRVEHVAAPPVGEWHFVAETGLRLREGRVELGLAPERGALPRRPCAEAAARVARREVGLRLGARDLLHRAGHEHLPAGLRVPEEGERGVRVGGELAALAALVVREEDEAPLVHAFEENRAGRGAAGLIRGRERHRLGQGDAGRHGLLLPLPEEGEGIRHSSSSIRSAPPSTRSPSATCTLRTTAS